MGRGTMPGWTFGVRPNPTNSYNPDYAAVRAHQRQLYGLDKVRQFPTTGGPYMSGPMLYGTEVPSLPGNLMADSGAQYTRLLHLA